ncbi:MAG: hypothetical protein LBH08_01270 [Puniceicoccales bacterium]|jgi:predicted  nucleic acid-binding Zn-ribbon protein|nr:hypothetical protein [Puniceicoccales bacterium]
MNEAIQIFLTLQNYDIRFNELEQKSKNISKSIADLEMNIIQWDRKIAQEKEEVQNIKLEIQKLEKKVQTTEETLAASKYQLALTRHSKESGILTKKIEDEWLKMSQKEELLLGKMLELDTKETEFSTLLQTAQSAILKIQNEQKDQRQHITDLEKNKSEIQNKIMAIRNILQENHAHWLKYYDRIQGIKMPRIAELRSDNICGGCYLKLSNYNNQRVDSNFPFIICEFCGRMIVITAELSTT